MKPIVLYCADLHAMSVGDAIGASFIFHNPKHQYIDDEDHCNCWLNYTNAIIEYGEKFIREEYEDQLCYHPNISHINENVIVYLCCSCANTVPNFDILIETVREYLKSDKS